MNQNQLKKDWDTLQNDFARLTTDISHMWKRMAGSPRDEFVEVKDHFGKKVDGYLHDLRNGLDSTYAKGRQIMGKQESTTPWKTLAVAFGIGVVLTAILKNTSSDKE